MRGATNPAANAFLAGGQPQGASVLQGQGYPNGYGVVPAQPAMPQAPQAYQPQVGPARPASVSTEIWDKLGPEQRAAVAAATSAAY